MAGEFPAQRVSIEEDGSIWLRHHEMLNDTTEDVDIDVDVVFWHDEIETLSIDYSMTPCIVFREFTIVNYFHFIFHPTALKWIYAK